MKVDEVAEDVPFEGLEKRLAAAFEPLEEVRPAEPFERTPARDRSAMTFASAGWADCAAILDVVAKTVPGHARAC